MKEFFNGASIDSFPINGLEPTGIQYTVGKVVEFYGISGNTDSSCLFVWDFGDDLGSTKENPNIAKTFDPTKLFRHSYARSGKYVVRFIEQRKNGMIIETVKTIKLAG